MNSKPIPVIPTDADWSVRTVGGVTTVLRRGTAPVYVDQSDVLAIGQRCVTATDFDGSRARPHSAKTTSKVITPEFDDVLVNSTGTGTIGRSVIFRDQTQRYMVDSHVTVVRPRQTELISRWLNDILRSPSGQRYLESRCYSGSTNQVELSSSALAAMWIAVPDVDEQRRVAEILDALDDQIRLTEQMVQKLSAVQVGLMRDLLGTEATAGVAADRGDLARSHGWSLSPLADVVGAPITYGIVQAGPHVPDGVPYVRTGDMSGDELRVEGMLRTSSRIADSYKRSTVRAGELVCAIRATVGKVLPVPPELDGANLTQGTARIAPGRGVDPRFLYWELRGERVQKQIALAIKGTTFFEITLGELRQIRVARPALPTQQEVAAVLDAQETVMRRERDFLSHLRALKDGLMADLLTGRVRVPEEAA